MFTSKYCFQVSGSFGTHTLGSRTAIMKLLKGNLEPMFLGLAVFVYGITFSYNTGYAINPARDLGPRLFIYIIGKLVDIYHLLFTF